VDFLDWYDWRMLDRSQHWIFAAAVAVAIACRIWLALLTYGTNDATTFEAYSRVIRNHGELSLYGSVIQAQDPSGKHHYPEIYSHPPFLVWVLSAFNRFDDWTGLPLHSSLRLLNAAADLGSILLTAAILSHIIGSVPFWSIIVVTLAPSWLFISGFHCNTDPLMLFFLVLSVYLLDVRRWTALGILSFALATGIKLVPLLLIPLLLFWLRNWTDRVRAVVILGAFWIVTAMPWLIHNPWGMLRGTLGYAGSASHWGLGLVLRHLPFIGPDLGKGFNASGRYILLLTLTLVGWKLNRNGPRIALFCQFGISFFLILLLMPGFGIQYLLWLTPWLAILPWRAAAIHLAASAAFCTVTYTYLCGGLPWYYACGFISDMKSSTWLDITWLGITSRSIDGLGLTTWLTVCFILVVYWWQLRAGGLGLSDNPIVRSPNAHVSI